MGGTAAASSGPPNLVGNEASYERLAAGGRRDDVAKPKSIKAAEHAKLQEERRQRERQERELEREKAKVAVTNSTVSGVVSAGTVMVANATSANNVANIANASTGPAPVLPSPSQSERLAAAREARANARAVAIAGTALANTAASGVGGKKVTPTETSAQNAASNATIASKGPTTTLIVAPSGSGRAPAMVPAGANNGEGSGHQRGGCMVTNANGCGTQAPLVPTSKLRPEPPSVVAAAVPAPPLAPAALLRQIELQPKRPEDNYEISDNGGDSEEDAETRDRSGKHVPAWCDTYIQALAVQADVDPDTIWGSRVPQCVLDDVFTDDMYRQFGKHQPKRARGSSGEWRKDRLTRQEVHDYKARMGHSRKWDPAERVAQSTLQSTGKP